MKPVAQDTRFSTLDESIVLLTRKKSRGSTDYMHSSPQWPLAHGGLKTSALYRLSLTIVLVLAVRCGAAEAGQPAALERAWTKPGQAQPAMLLAQAATPPVALPNLAKVAVKMIPGSAVEVGSK